MAHWMWLCACCWEWEDIGVCDPCREYPAQLWRVVCMN
jgi:hypothetical protein